MYRVTKFFTGGLLKGLTIQEITSVKFREGFEAKHPVCGSPYKIIKIEEIEEKQGEPVTGA